MMEMTVIPMLSERDSKPCALVFASGFGPMGT